MLLYELSVLEMQILEKLYSKDGIDKEVYDQLKLDEEEKIVRCAKLYRQLVSDMQACKEEANRLGSEKEKTKIGQCPKIVLKMSAKKSRTKSGVLSHRY